MQRVGHCGARAHARFLLPANGADRGSVSVWLGAASPSSSHVPVPNAPPPVPRGCSTLCEPPLYVLPVCAPLTSEPSNLCSTSAAGKGPDEGPGGWRGFLRRGGSALLRTFSALVDLVAPLGERVAGMPPGAARSEGFEPFGRARERRHHTRRAALHHSAPKPSGPNDRDCERFADGPRSAGLTICRKEVKAATAARRGWRDGASTKLSSTPLAMAMDAAVNDERRARGAGS
jgi:hypothetical protein